MDSYKLLLLSTLQGSPLQITVPSNPRMENREKCEENTKTALAQMTKITVIGRGAWPKDLKYKWGI